MTGAIANGEINCKNIPTSPLNPTASSTSDAEIIAPINQIQNFETKIWVSEKVNARRG